MTRRLAWAMVGACAFVCSVERLDAQLLSKPLEIGVDGQLAFVSGGRSATSLSLPVHAFRIGLSLNDNVEIEPVFSFDYTKLGDDHDTSYGIGAGLVWNFSADRKKSQWYARPFVLMSGVDGSGGVSDYRFAIGAGAGIRCPMTSHLSFRTEANVGNWLKRGDRPSRTAVGLLFGLSLWTK